MLCPVLHNLSCCARMKLHSIFWTKKKQVHLWYTLHGCCPWSHHSGRCCRGVHRNQQPSWAILRVFVFIHHHSLPHHFWWLNLACRCWYSSPDAVWRCLGSTLPLLCSLTGITVSYQVGKLYGYSVPFYSYEFMWRQVQVFFFFFCDDCVEHFCRDVFLLGDADACRCLLATWSGIIKREGCNLSNHNSARMMAPWCQCCLPQT